MGKSHEVSALQKNYRHLRNSGNERNSLPQGQVHHLATRYQMIGPENTYANNTVQNEDIIYVYTYIHAIIITGKRFHEFEGGQGGSTWKSIRRKEEG